MKRRLGPDGVHYFDRRSGLNLLVDEVEVAEAHWDSAPRQVSIALTNACDLACSFCYAPKHAAVLDVGRLIEWCEELDEAGSLGVGFGGGEPTLYRELPHLCRQLNVRTDVAVTMTTHGHAWTPRLVGELEEDVHFVRVSVDGVGATYEAMRNRSFDRLLDRLELISGAFPMGMNCVVNDLTLPDLDAVAELAEKLGAAELLLLLERPARGRLGADTVVASRLSAWIERYQGPVPVALSDGDLHSLPIAVALPRETGLRSYVHIDAAGTAKRTSYDRSGEAIDDRGVLAAIGRLRRDAA